MPTDTVDFVLTLGGGLQPGVVRPPPQRLRIPVSLLDPQLPAMKPPGAIEAGTVALRIPDEQSGAALRMSISATAAGWQQRTRNLTDPDRGAYPHYTKASPDASGLRAILSQDPSRHDNPYESVYLAEDAQLGFVHVKCMGFAQQRPRNCRVTSELAPHLTVSIHLPEDALGEWRPRTLAAHAFARTLLL
jgi:hypothetical protein